MKKKEEQEKPIRQISNRGYRKIIGRFPSIKCGRSVRFESLLEMDFIYHLEQDKLVKAYCEQPCKISYYSNNRHRIYVPDFKVHRTDQPRALLIEVKPMEKVLKQVSRLKQIKKAAQAMGYDFHIVTEASIRQEPKLSILKYLHRYASIKISPECLYETISYLRQQKGTATIGMVEERLSKFGFLRQEVYKMFYDGTLQVDFATQLSSDATVVLCSSYIKD